MKYKVCTNSYQDFDFILQEFDTRRKLHDWLEALLLSTNKIHFESRLNDIQRDCGGEGLFKNKETIPIAIINLMLKEFGLEIKEQN